MTTDVLGRRFKQTTNRQLTGGCVDFLTGDHTVVVAVGGGLGGRGGGTTAGEFRENRDKQQPTAHLVRLVRSLARRLLGGRHGQGLFTQIIQNKIKSSSEGRDSCR